MISFLFTWILVFLICLSIGMSFSILLDRLFKVGCDFILPEYFFSGFLILSVISGYLSLFIPVGNTLLIGLSVISAILILLNFKKVSHTIKFSLDSFRMQKPEMIVLSIISVFILATVSNIITWGDTGLYHTQAIQWIRKYPVVPGLGNIHGRLAFNSMFFVVSGLFTFEFRGSIIYPLNSLCLIVLIVRLVNLFAVSREQKSAWKMAFYGLQVIFSLLMLAPMLNSPSPDVICSIIIIFVFTYLFEYVQDRKEVTGQQFLLISAAVFSCAGFKISSLLLSGALLFFLAGENFLRRSFLALFIGVLILTPFIIRNYYLSGYALYPYPEIDIFKVDWKIPYSETLGMKQEIEGWAKMSKAIPYPDVMNVRFTTWLKPWFIDMNFNNKVLIVTNFLSCFTFLLMLLRKKYILAGVQVLVLINIAFWLATAPDPRFIYGFLIVGFALTISYIIYNLENFSARRLTNVIQPALMILLIIVFIRRISKPVDTLVNPSYWIIPAPYQVAETKLIDSGFQYYVSVPEGDNCYNTDIPCVPYELKNIVLRGKTLTEGFRVESETKK